MSAINFAMSDIYGGYAGTTEATIPDADDQNALTDVSTDNTRPIKTSVKNATGSKMWLAIALILIAVVVIGGKF